MTKFWKPLIKALDWNNWNVWNQLDDFQYLVLLNWILMYWQYNYWKYWLAN